MSSYCKHHRLAIHLFRHGCNRRSKITNTGSHKVMENHSLKIPQIWEKYSRCLRISHFPFLTSAEKLQFRVVKGLPSSPPAVYVSSGLQNICYTPSNTPNSSSPLSKRKRFLLTTFCFLSQVSPDTWPSSPDAPQILLFDDRSLGDHNWKTIFSRAIIMSLNIPLKQLIQL